MAFVFVRYILFVVSRRETVISYSDVSDWFKREQVVQHEQNGTYNGIDNWYLHNWFCTIYY